VAFGRVVLWDFDSLVTPHLAEFMVWGGRLYLPWQMLFYLWAGLVGGIAVSLLTRPVEEGKLENFYALLRTPVVPGEQVATPCTLPEGARVPARRNLFANTELEIPVPSAVGVIGFVVGCACAGRWWRLFMRSRRVKERSQR
jgi:hypothetical protein